MNERTQGEEEFRVLFEPLTTGPVDASHGGQATESQRFRGYMRAYSVTSLCLVSCPIVQALIEAFGLISNFLKPYQQCFFKKFLKISVCAFRKDVIFGNNFRACAFKRYSSIFPALLLVFVQTSLLRNFKSGKRIYGCIIWFQIISHEHHVRSACMLNDHDLDNTSFKK